MRSFYMGNAAEGISNDPEYVLEVASDIETMPGSPFDALTSALHRTVQD